MDSIHEFEIKNKTVKIYLDECGESPREWDNLGTMAFFHKRYNLGDDHEFSTPEDLNLFLEEKNPIFLFVYGYDHGGLAISTRRSGQFADPWDSGILGVIYVEKGRVREEYDWKNLTSDRIKRIESYLNNEVEIYNLYLQGRIYGFISTCDFCGEEDSCWGFYGEDWKNNGVIDENNYHCSCLERSYNQLMEIKE